MNAPIDFYAQEIVTAFYKDLDPEDPDDEYEDFHPLIKPIHIVSVHVVQNYVVVTRSYGDSKPDPKNLSYGEKPGEVMICTCLIDLDSWFGEQEVLLEDDLNNQDKIKIIEVNPSML